MLLKRLRKDKHIQSYEPARNAVNKELEMPPVPTSKAIGATMSILESRISSSKSLAGPMGDLVAALRALVLPPKGQDPKPPLEAIDTVLYPEENDEEGWESGSVLAENQMSEDSDSADNRVKDTVNLTSKSRRPTVGIPIPHTSTTDDEESGSEHYAPSPSTKGLSNQNGGDSLIRTEAGESTFLPSLAVGYTRGDSSASEWSGDGRDTIDPSPRKNRRGQRARKAYVAFLFGFDI